MKNSNINVKVLLVILIAVAVAAIPLALLVMPEMKNSQNAMQEALTAQTNADALHVTINTLPQKQAEYDTMVQNSEVTQKAIPFRQKTYDIDLFLRQIIQGAGATITDLSISEYQEVTDEILKKATDETGEAETTDDGTRIYPKLQYYCTVNMSIEGDLQTVLNAFDAIDKAGKNIMLTDFDLQIQVLGGDEAIVAVPVGTEEATEEQTAELTNEDATQKLSPRDLRKATIQIMMFAADIPTEPIETPMPTPAPDAAA